MTVKKIALMTFSFLYCSSAMGYHAQAPEFPNAFIGSVQNKIDYTLEAVQECDSVSCVVGPISLMSRTSSLDQVKKLLGQLDTLTMTDVAGSESDSIRLSSLYKLIVPLVVFMNNQILDHLQQVDTLLEYWKEAQEYTVQFHLHAKSPRAIVRRLELLQEELCERLGSIVIHINGAPFDKDVRAQYEWFQELCNHFNAVIPNQTSLLAQPVFEAVAVMLSKSITSVEKFSAVWQKRLDQYQQPSFLRRRVGSIVGAAVACVGGGPAIVKNKDTIQAKSKEAYTNVKRVGADQAELVREALFDQSKGLADIAQRRRDIGDQYRDFLYGQLLEYSSVEADRKAAIVHALVRKNDVADKAAVRPSGDAAIDDAAFEQVAPALLKAHYDAMKIDALQARYKALHDDKKVPEAKACAKRLHADFLTPDAIEEAAESADPNFLVEKVIPLIFSTLQEEGVDVKQALHILGPVTRHVLDELAPILETLDAVKQAQTKAGGIWNALFAKQDSKGAKGDEDDNADASAAAHNTALLSQSAIDLTQYQKGDGKLDLAKVVPGLTNGVTPPVRTALSIPQAFMLVANAGKLSAERLNWQLKWVKALALGGIAGIPVYGVYKGAAALYGRTKKTSSYDGLLETLRELKKLFLVNGNKQQSEMDPCDVGFTHYLVYKLERERVPKKYRNNFRADVRALQKPDLSAGQKYNFVKDVLQDGYPFLRPVAPVE